eukprot:Hpha_TRINITY_DN5222_c0_g1::TRINITY_DN5222_c0_g1_i1::g.116545::m.116545
MEGEGSGEAPQAQAGTELTVGDAIRVRRRISFKTGKTVEVGALGQVTKVPGLQKGSAAQVRVGGHLFSVEAGDIEHALDQADLAAIREQRRTLLFEQERMSGNQIPFSMPLAPDVPTPPESEDGGIAGSRASGERERLVPVRYVHYVDPLGHWGDELQKQRVARLQSQLQAAAGRLTEEAAAKFEEVAWLQREVERWYTEAEKRRVAFEQMRATADAKDDALQRTAEALKTRQSDVNWLREELRRKNTEANAALQDVARLEQQVREKTENQMHMERTFRQRNEEDATKAAEMEQQIRRLNKHAGDMDEELRKREETILVLESQVKHRDDLILTYRHHEQQLVSKSDAQTGVLERQVQELQNAVQERDTKATSNRDMGCQAELVDAEDAAQIDLLRAVVAAREQEVQRLQRLLEEAYEDRATRMRMLQAELQDREERISSLEVERG